MPLPAKPTPQSDKDVWGGKLNTYLDALTPKNPGTFMKNVGGTLIEVAVEDEVAATAAVQAKADLTVVTKLTTRLFDARDYGADPANADNIPAINAAIADAAASVAAEGGSARVVVGASAKTFLIRPSLSAASWIKLQSGVTLDLSDVTLKVADDSDAYNDLIAQVTSSTPIIRARVTGGLIDNNPTGHAGANIGIGSGNKAYAIRFLNTASGIVIDGVTFNNSGINTVVVNGADCHDVSIEGDHFTFTQGAAVTPDYDNSACYLVADEIRVSNNKWEAAIAQEARACCEIHGPNAVMTGNTAKGYRTLVNLVTPDFVYAGARNNLAVTSNSVVDGNEAVTLWPVDGDTLRDVVIVGNTVHLAQIDRNENSAWGITTSRASGIGGDIEGLVIAANAIVYQPGDTRSVDSNGLAIDYAGTTGIGLGGRGTTRHAVVTGNLVRNAPSYAIRVGVVSPGVVTDALVANNLLVDGGSNPNLAPKAVLTLTGTVNETEVRDNKIRDTGPTTRNATYGVFVSLTAGTGNLVTRNRVTSASTALSAVTPDTYVSYNTKRVTLDFPSIAAGATATLTATVPGATVGDAAIATPVNAPESGLAWNAYVSAANTVAVRMTNLSAAAIDPVSRSWDIRVIPREFAVT